MELIKLNGETAILDGDTAQKIAEFEKRVKDLKAKEDKLKKLILEEMEAKGIIKLNTDMLSITYVAPTERESLDSKKLRADLPNVYDSYINIKPVKSSIRIRLKG